MSSTGTTGQGIRYTGKQRVETERQYSMSQEALSLLTSYSHHWARLTYPSLKRRDQMTHPTGKCSFTPTPQRTPFPFTIYLTWKALLTPEKTLQQINKHGQRDCLSLCSLIDPKGNSKSQTFKSTSFLHSQVCNLSDLTVPFFFFFKSTLKTKKEITQSTL